MNITKIKSINLALQGGGSHGAYTWGVLSTLLDEPCLQIEAVSGVSSGAMNAVVMAHGLGKGGVIEAKKNLGSFWGAVAAKYTEMFEFSPANLWDKVVGMENNVQLETYLGLTETFSPYQLNPFNLNPLRDVLEEHVDFELLRKDCPVKLFIGATQVRTGKMKIFSNEDITADVVLASACLPSIHHAIEIDGEAYWDGGYSGNPPLFPLIFNTISSDILVVLLQPLNRNSVPKTADEIKKRAHELSFTNTFLREMRAIAMSKQHLRDDFINTGKLDKTMKQLNLHMIEDKSFERLGNDSRYKVDSVFIQNLHEDGRKSAEAWLKEHYESVQVSSSIDLEALFY